jgi:hypothetical protein
MMAIISIFKFHGETTLLVCSALMEDTKPNLLAALAATRADLPPGHEASLTTPDGKNVA